MSLLSADRATRIADVDLTKALRLAREARDALREAQDARRYLQRADNWGRDAEHDWLRAREAAFGAVAVASRLSALIDGAPDPESFTPDAGDDFDPPLQATLKLVALLENHDDLKAIARSTTPALSVESLHRWVRDAAASFWADGHHRAAVHAAAAQVELHLQAKLGRNDVSGVALVRQAFTLDKPQPGKPRLRFPHFEEGSERFRSIHEGAGALGAGLVQAFRNTAAHDPLRPLSPAIAVEQLAGFSMLARIIASAKIERHPEDHFDEEDDDTITILGLGSID
jgi:uncharacterized protein (TIGR02391 family)